MKLRLVCLLAIAGALAPALSGALVDPTVHLRAGFDSNPVATGGDATSAIESGGTLTIATGLAFGVVSPARADAAFAKLAYAGETVRFEEFAGEDYTTHRLAGSGQSIALGWRISGEASAFFVDGSRDTLLAIAACNGNALSLWRERREQWQYRGKFLAQRDAGVLRFRVVGTLLDYDYRTRVQAGRVAFADRGDLLGGADLGWIQSAQSLWFAGARIGMQNQDTVALPGGSFEYSNRYTRILAGWEGRLGADTTLALAAGPDFRRYNGAVDPRIFHGQRRTLGWFETALATKLSPQLSLTVKSTRWTWLSSTGKSAYTDLSGEVLLAWAVDETLTLRASAKAHQCSYFPAVRNDWEYIGGLGVTLKASSRWQLIADVLDHRGWNELSGVADRRFTRTVLWLGASVKL